MTGSVVKNFLDLSKELRETLPVNAIELEYRLNKDLKEAAKKETLCETVTIHDYAIVNDYSTGVIVTNPEVNPYTISPQFILVGASFVVQDGIITAKFDSMEAEIIDIEEPYKGLAEKVLKRCGYSFS